MNSAPLPLLATAARLAADCRTSAPERPPHSTKELARVGAYPLPPHQQDAVNESPSGRITDPPYRRLVSRQDCPDCPYATVGVHGPGLLSGLPGSAGRHPGGP